MGWIMPEIKTKLCDLLGIKYPIIQAAMGGFASPLTKLAAAVSEAGGLGTISHAGTLLTEFPIPREKLPGIIKKLKKIQIGAIHEAMSLTDKPFGMNCRVARLQPDAPHILKAILEERERDPRIKEHFKVLITSAGDPACFGLNQKIRESGLLHFHTVATAYHARKAEAVGLDGIIASGYEGGAHVNSFTPINTMVLVPRVVEAVKIPVVAGGGMCDGKTLVAALALGAQGVYMGTRFVASLECDYHDKYKDTIVEASAGDSRVPDTIVTKGFLGDYRVYYNEGAKQVVKMVQEEVPDEERMKFERAGRIRGVLEGDMDHGIVPMGQGAVRVHKVLSAREIINGIMREASEIVEKLSSLQR